MAEALGLAVEIQKVMVAGSQVFFPLSPLSTEFYHLVFTLLPRSEAEQHSTLCLHTAAHSRASVAPQSLARGWTLGQTGLLCFSLPTGFDAIATARIFHKLMNRFGFKEYYLQGGDWGSRITTNMAQMLPQWVAKGISAKKLPPVLLASWSAPLCIQLYSYALHWYWHSSHAF